WGLDAPEAKETQPDPSITWPEDSTSADHTGFDEAAARTAAEAEAARAHYAKENANLASDARTRHGDAEGPLPHDAVVYPGPDVASGNVDNNDAQLILDGEVYPEPDVAFGNLDHHEEQMALDREQQQVADYYANRNAELGVDARRGRDTTDAGQNASAQSPDAAANESNQPGRRVVTDAGHRWDGKAPE